MHLSPREAEIIHLVATGLPNKCIGAVLEISTWTVATHLRRIFAKLGVNSRAAMIARAGGAVASQARLSPAGEAGPAPPAAVGWPEGRGAGSEAVGAVADPGRGAAPLRKPVCPPAVIVPA